MPDTPEWRPVPEWTMYEVSDAGVIRNVHTGHLLALNEKSGAYSVSLQSGEKKGYRGPRPTISRSVHDIVCTAFHGPSPSPDHQVSHRDGDRHNNRVDNLRWTTRAEDDAYRAESGLKPRSPPHSTAHLSPAAVREIYASGQPHWALARKHGVSRKAVGDIKLGRRWSEITGHKEKP